MDNVTVSAAQQSDSATHTYPFSPKLPSYPGCHIPLRLLFSRMVIQISGFGDSNQWFSNLTCKNFWNRYCSIPIPEIFIKQVYKWDSRIHISNMLPADASAVCSRNAL